MKINVIALIGPDLEFFHEMGRRPGMSVTLHRLTHHPDWLRTRSIAANVGHWLAQLVTIASPILFGRNVIFGTALVRALWPLFWWSRRFVWVLNEIPGESTSVLGRLDRLILRRAHPLFVSSRERAEHIARRYGRIVDGQIPNLPHFDPDHAPARSSWHDRSGMIYTGLISNHRLPTEALHRLDGLGVDVDLYGYAVDDLSLDDLTRVRYHGARSVHEVRTAYAGYAFGLLAYPTTDVNNNLCAPIKIYEYLRYDCVCLSLNRNEGLVAMTKRYPALFARFEAEPSRPPQADFERQREALFAETLEEVSAAGEAVAGFLERRRGTRKRLDA